VTESLATKFQVTEARMAPILTCIL
jgi:hypothetical protein